MTLNTTSGKSQLPPGSEVFDNQLKALNEFFQKEITDSPELELLCSKKFQNQEQATQALKTYIMSIWKHPEKMQEFGFTANYEDMRKTNQAQTLQVIGQLSNDISTLFRSLLVKDPSGSFYYSLEAPQVEKLTKKMEAEMMNHNEGTALLPGQTNTQANIIFQQLQNFLTQAPTRLRAAIKNEDFPSHIIDRSYQDTTRYTQIKTIFAMASWSMMIYGHHGAYKNILSNFATNEHNGQPPQSGVPFQPGFFEMLNHDWQGVSTWPLAVISASVVGVGVMKGVGYIRKLWIEDAEARRIGVPLNRKVSTNKQVALASTAIFVGLSVPLAYEMGGLLEHGVVGHYVAYEAFKTKKVVSQVLDMKNPQSPSGKAKMQYDAATNTITLASQRLPDEENQSKQSGGMGPSWNVKMYPQSGPTIMQNPLFAQATPGEKGAVQNTEQKLMTIGPVLGDGKNFHQKYPTLPDKAKRLGKVFEEDTAGLLAQSTELFGDIYNKKGSAEVKELLDARVKIKESVEEYLKGLGAANARWGQRASAYQELFDTLLAESNAKYKRNTKIDITIPVQAPDVTALKAELERPLPEFKGKGISELLDVLNSLAETGTQNGGISKTEKNMVLAGILLRVGILELTLIYLLVAGVRKARKYYSVDVNALGTQKEFLDGLDEKLIQSTMATFSGEGWENIFGKGQSGITYEQAKFIVREILVSYDGELEKYEASLESGEQKFSAVEKIGRLVRKRIAPSVAILFMGDTRIRDERHVAAKGRAYEKMSDLAKPENSGIAIPDSVVQNITQYLIPQEAIGDTPKDTAQITARYNKAIGLVSRKLGKLHEHTRTAEAQKIEAEQRKYATAITGLQGEVFQLQENLGQIQMILGDSDLLDLHSGSQDLKGQITAWIEKIKSIKAQNTTEDELSNLQISLSRIQNQIGTLEKSVQETI